MRLGVFLKSFYYKVLPTRVNILLGTEAINITTFIMSAVSLYVMYDVKTNIFVIIILELVLTNELESNFV